MSTKAYDKASAELTKALFYNLVLDHFRSALAPGDDFIQTCYDSNMSAGETAALWSNRLR